MRCVLDKLEIGQEEERMHQVENTGMSRSRNEPSRAWGWRGARPGWGQVREPARSVMKRLVRESSDCRACVKHICGTLCLELFWRAREFGSACIFSLVFSALF